MASIVSQRGQENIVKQNLPWRFAPVASKKYDPISNPDGLISFALAENSAVQEELAKYVAENVRIPVESFLYPQSSTTGPNFPNAMASFINEHFGPFTPIIGSQIIPASGVTAIDSMLAHSLCDPGDGILAGGPIYGRFELDFWNEARVNVVYAKAGGLDLLDSGVVERFEIALREAEAAGTRIRALMISNPSNPLGECYSKEALRDIMKFCQRHRIHLISDEIYALSVFDNENADAVPFTSVLSFDTAGVIDPDFLHVLYGMSKDFGAAGLRLGCLITRSITTYRACSSIARFHNASGPSLAIATAILEDRRFLTRFLALCRSSLADAYKLATRSLEDANIPYRKGGNAGFFIYIDLSRWLPNVEKDGAEREFALAQHLVDHGVFLHPGEEHCKDPGWFRLVFSSMPEAVLKEGFARLKAALASLSST